MRHRLSGRDSIDDLERGTEEFIAHATTSAMKEGADLVKTAWRDQIRRAGHGERLARTIRSQTYPKTGASVEAAALIWTKAADIIDAFSRGASIVTVNGGRFMAIPTDAVPTVRGGKALGPREVAERFGRPLQFIPNPKSPGDGFYVMRGLRARGKSGRWRNPTLLEKERRADTTTVVMFVLTPRVKMPNTLDREAVARLAETQYPDLLTKHWR